MRILKSISTRRRLITLAAVTGAGAGSALLAGIGFQSRPVHAAGNGGDPCYDVKANFGAVGDEVTDDTAALQAALATAGTTGGIVFLPPGTYRILSRLVVPFGVELRGSGRLASWIKAGAGFPTNTELVRLGDLSGNIGVGCRIRGVGVDCNDIPGSTGVYSERINENSGVFECLIWQFVSHGIWINQPTSGATAQNWSIEEVEIAAGSQTGAGGVGLAITGTNLAVAMKRISRVTIGATGFTPMTYAITIDGTLGGVLSDIHVENVVNGIQVGTKMGCWGLTVENVTGQETVTNLLVIGNIAGQGPFTAVNIVPNRSTHTIVDQPRGHTMSGFAVGLYGCGIGALGNQTILTTDNSIPNTFASPVSLLSALHPATPGGTSQGGSIYMGAGAPDNSHGNSGDFYYRTDAPQIPNQRIYIKSGGSWVGIV